MYLKNLKDLGLPCGPVVKNLSARARGVDLIPALGRSYMPLNSLATCCNDQAREPVLGNKRCQRNPHTTTRQ